MSQKQGKRSEQKKKKKTLRIILVVLFVGKLAENFQRTSTTITFALQLVWILDFVESTMPPTNLRRQRGEEPSKNFNLLLNQLTSCVLENIFFLILREVEELTARTVQ